MYAVVAYACVAQNIPLLFAGLTSVLNFNDTSIKMGADVSQLSESEVEGSVKSRFSNIECKLTAERNLRYTVDISMSA